MSRPTATLATCAECEWVDGGAGCKGRAARHHDATRHVVRVITTYGPAAPAQAEELPLEYAGDPDPTIERTL